MTHCVLGCPWDPTPTHSTPPQDKAWLKLFVLCLWSLWGQVLLTALLLAQCWVVSTEGRLVPCKWLTVSTF